MKLRTADLTERGRGVLRGVAGAVVAGAIVIVSLQILATLFQDDSLPDGPVEPVGGVVELRATDPIRVRVEVDGEQAFAGVMCRGDNPCKQSFGPARKIAVEMADLERAQVRYNGRRVKPLGTLDEPRTLVFIDDSP
ncbi:MAG: hypothetical protein ACI9VR_003886 [Cognaticolwellia sp.]